MLDTSVAIALRDGDASVIRQLRAAASPACFSVVTLVELEAGLFGRDADLRRERLATLLETIPVIEFTEAEAVAYGRILTDTGFSRRKVLDRMIAAQAIVAGATLATLNPVDFRDIPGLSLLEW
ncbi:PIN domain-containing protein [Brevundimonas sp. A19_0]|uniref:PIN domain-containing protein n=1 Tax=Brevundimonas sp. A19_0 TaxID=2821087 RepID=UPI001ADA9925|nr:PIN domain-containing protein [Brevundimonas sp. A19_0]MBO9500907.1 PIN domain-containing protein [Brevundimonas sp. A19_0]